MATLPFGIGLAAVFATPLIFLAYAVASVEHHRLQTWLMRFGGGLAIAPVAGMGLMGLGGFVAIVGGMLFVAEVIMAVVRRPRASAGASSA